MNKIKIILFVILLFSLKAFSQANFDQKTEKIKALKVSFITSHLSLTADEAAKFWPIYNAYSNNQYEIKHKKLKPYLRRANEDGSKMSDNEATALLAQILETEKMLYQAQKKLVTDLKTILPSIKIIKLKKAEDDFNKKLLEQFKRKS